MKKSLKNVLDAFSKARVLCVGDIMLDRFIQGKVERISPEAPVPIFQFACERQMLGGAGNVVANIHSLEASVCFLGMVGNDGYGKLIEALLQDVCNDYYLLSSKERPTIMKARFISGSTHLLRYDQEKILPLNAKEEKKLLDIMKKKLPKIDVVLLSDYAKGFCTETFCQKLINLCQEQGKHVLVDPKGSDYSKYSGAFLVKPNRKELEQAAGISLDVSCKTFLSDVEKAARVVLYQNKIENLIVTLSEKGMLYVSADKAIKPVYLSTYAHEVYDVSGAGDTSLSALGVALACGANIQEAMEISNHAAGVVVAKLGTATVSRHELRLKLAQQKDRANS